MMKLSKFDPNPRCCYDIKQERYWEGYAAAMDDVLSEAVKRDNMDFLNWVEHIRRLFALDKPGVDAVDSQS